MIQYLQGERCGERDPREGDREELQERDEHERHHGGRQLLHVQREVCQGAAAAQCGNVRLHPGSIQLL